MLDDRVDALGRLLGQRDSGFELGLRPDVGLAIAGFAHRETAIGLALDHALDCGPGGDLAARATDGVELVALVRPPFARVAPALIADAQRGARTALVSSHRPCFSAWDRRRASLDLAIGAEEEIARLGLEDMLAHPPQLDQPLDRPEDQALDGGIIGLEIGGHPVYALARGAQQLEHRDPAGLDEDL